MGYQSHNTTVAKIVHSSIQLQSLLHSITDNQWTFSLHCPACCHVVTSFQLLYHHNQHHTEDYCNSCYLSVTMNHFYQGHGKPGSIAPLKFEIGVKKLIPRLCRTGDFWPWPPLKNGSRTPDFYLNNARLHQWVELVEFNVPLDT